MLSVNFPEFFFILNYFFRVFLNDATVVYKDLYLAHVYLTVFSLNSSVLAFTVLIHATEWNFYVHFLFNTFQYVILYRDRYLI